MAKSAVKTKPAPEKPAAKGPARVEKPAPKEAGIGIAYLAGKLNTSPAAVRAKLRGAEVPVGANGRYNWPTEKAADAVAKQLSAKKGE